MKISEALDNERNRKEKEKWNKMYLHKDGKFDSGITKFKLIRNKQIKAHENNI